jgi:Protein of unknown function (DUF3179)
MTLKRRYLIISVCFATALFCLVCPIYVIRPFRHQGGTELQAALLVLRFRGIVELVAAFVATALAVGARRKAGVVALTVASIVCAGLSRVNIYERMFHPITNITFGAAADSKLDSDEKVIAVAIGKSARAYPIRSISYHHIVNDVVDGVPIAATY